MEWALAPAGLTCRPLVWEDAPQLQALLEACYGYFAVAEQRKVSAREGQERIAEALGDEQQGLLGVWASDALLGLLDLRLDVPEPASATLALLLIHPGQRRRGHAAALVAEVARVASEAGLLSLHLGVRQGASEASAFWEAQGFEEAVRGAGVTEYVRHLD